MALLVLVARVVDPQKVNCNAIFPFPAAVSPPHPARPNAPMPASTPALIFRKSRRPRVLSISLYPPSKLYPLSKQRRKTKSREQHLFPGTNRLIDTQDDLDGLASCLTIDERSSILSNSTDHVGGLQDMTSQRERGTLLSDGSSVALLLLGLRCGSRACGFLTVVACE